MPFKELITPKIVAECVILDERGWILLVNRKDNNEWALPGGFMELGERILDAAFREVAEETGLAVDICGLSGVYSDPGDSLYLHLGPQYQVVALVFLAKSAEGEFKPNPETYGFEFFGRDALPPLMRGHAQRIADALDTEDSVAIR